MTQPLVPTTGPEAEHRARIATTLNEALKGRLNNVGTFTLTESDTTTTVLDNLFNSDQVPVLMPTTATAAAAMTEIYLTARANGSFTLTHDSTADTDRTFLYIRCG